MTDKRWMRLSRRGALSAMGGVVAASSVPGARAATTAGGLDVKLDIDGYKVTDSFFEKAYVDLDEVRTDFARHRFIHGGFQNTGTRFSFLFPEPDKVKSRFIQPLEGGTAGNEYSYGTPVQGMASPLGGLDTAIRLGAFLVQSNQGHVGTDFCPKGKQDLSIYGWRASAETGRFARYLATQIYGETPKYGYVFGGSGGGKRSPTCLENAPDVWVGCLPFMGGADVDPENQNKPTVATQVIFYSALLNVQRMLRGKPLQDVIDAVEPGGSGDPFATLTVDQRQALTELYRCGYPRGAEWLIDPDRYTGQILEWAWSAEEIDHLDPTYFSDFWSKPGYAGHDNPRQFDADLIDTVATVKKVVTAADMAAAVKAGGPESRASSAVNTFRMKPDAVIGVQLEQVPKGYMLGTAMAIQTGDAKGRTIYCTAQAGDTYLANAIGEAGNLRFAGVKAGDKIKLTNKNYMAYCSWFKHHVVPRSAGFANMMVDGVPLYPQRPVQVPATVFTGGKNSAKFAGKMLWFQHTHDTAVWPEPAFYYAEEVAKQMGEKAAKERFCLRFTENAHHAPGTSMPKTTAPLPTTRLINYTPHIEQGLQDLINWVEKNIQPQPTHATFADGKVVLPPTAATRGGIQPVVHALANGKERAEIKAGQMVTLSVDAEVPPGAGNLIALEWDFDGNGTFPFKHPEIDGKSNKAKLSTSFSFEKPGVYFASVRATSHREGDVNATSRRIENLARVRIVVSAVQAAESRKAGG